MLDLARVRKNLRPTDENSTRLSVDNSNSSPRNNRLLHRTAKCGSIEVLGARGFMPMADQFEDGID